MKAPVVSETPGDNEDGEGERGEFLGAAITEQLKFKREIVETRKVAINVRPFYGWILATIYCHLIIWYNWCL